MCSVQMMKEGISLFAFNLQLSELLDKWVRQGIYKPGSQSDSRNKNLPLFLLILKVMYWNRALNYLASEAIASPQDNQNKADWWNPNTKNKTLLLRSRTSWQPRQLAGSYQSTYHWHYWHLWHASWSRRKLIWLSTMATWIVMVM